MNKTIRKFYTIFAFVVFFISLFVVIFLAMGYSYNFAKKSVEKRSVLYIKSYPRGAEVYLNDNLYKQRTPTQINFLKPDLYNIEIRKEKYQSWKKKMLIKANETVFIENVSLFLSEVTKTIIKQGDFSLLSYSPDKSKFLSYDNKNKALFIFNVDQENYSSLYTPIKDIVSSLWSNDSSITLIQTKKQNLIVYSDYLNSPMLDIGDYVKFKIKDFFWDKFDSNLLYFLDEKNNAYKFELSTKKVQQLNISSVITLKPEGEKIYYISRFKDKDANMKMSLNLISLKDEKIETVYNFDTLGEMEFILTNRDYFCVLNKNNKRLYVIDPNTPNYLIKSFENVNGASWDIYNRILLVYGDFEISIYDVITNEFALINRSSEKIKTAFWHKNNNHILYAMDDKLFVVEIDYRDQKNVFELKNIDSSGVFFPNKKGDILYYITLNGIEKSVIQ